MHRIVGPIMVQKVREPRKGKRDKAKRENALRTLGFCRDVAVTMTDSMVPLMPQIGGVYGVVAQKLCKYLRKRSRLQVRKSRSAFEESAVDNDKSTRQKCKFFFKNERQLFRNRGQ